MSPFDMMMKLKLNGTNYDSWAKNTKFYLMSEGLWKYALTDVMSRSLSELSEDYEKRVTTSMKKEAEMALGLIACAVEDDYSEDIQESKTAFEAWEVLKKNWIKQSVGNLNTWRHEFGTAMMEEGGDVNAHITKLESLRRLLKGSAAPVAEGEMVLRLMKSLPDSWDTFCTGLRARQDIMTKYEEVKSEIKDESVNRGISKPKEKEKRPAFSGYKKDTPHGAKSTGTCHNCGTKGHKAADCWKKGGGKEGGGPQQKTGKPWEKKQSHNANKKQEGESSTPRYCMTSLRQANLSFADAAKRGTANKSKEWIIDSGATDHLCWSREDFTEYQPMKGKGIEVICANSDPMEVLGSGTVEVTMSNGQQHVLCVLQNVLHIPALGTNLLSLGQLDKRGYRTHISKGKIEIESGTGEKVFECRQRLDGLYVANNEKDKHACSAKSNIDQWHLRLGHLNELDLKKSLPDLAKEQLSDCETCLTNKARKLPFNKQRIPRPEKPMDLIVTDVAGPMKVKGIEGEQYFAVYIDASTDFVVVDCMKKKSEQEQALMAYVKYGQTKFDTKVKRIKCDNGGEYTTSTMLDWAVNNGTEMEYTNPYTPQQNGMAERRIQTLCNGARCLMQQANLGQEYWPDAIRVMAHIRNRVKGSNSREATPYQKWEGKSIDGLDYVQVFGSVCYVLIDKGKRTKFDERSRKCIMIGYTNNGYKLQEMASGRIMYSRDVRFPKVTEFLAKGQPEQEHCVRFDTDEEDKRPDEEDAPEPSNRYEAFDDNEVEVPTTQRRSTRTTN